MSDKGKAAIAAAAAIYRDHMAIKACDDIEVEAERAARAIIRAYLEKLPGHRLVQRSAIEDPELDWTAFIEAAPPPPGLEDSSDA